MSSVNLVVTGKYYITQPLSSLQCTNTH